MPKPPTRAFNTLLGNSSFFKKIIALIAIAAFAYTWWQSTQAIPYANPTPHSFKNAITGKVIGVSDGDTIDVLDAQRVSHRIRLAYIDAPEKSQTYGMQAKQALADKVYLQTVTVNVVDQDKYQRLVGQIWLNNQDINQQQIQEGWAWFYSKYAQQFANATLYQQSQLKAQENHIGLWKEASPTAPWEYRRQNKP